MSKNTGIPYELFVQQVYGALQRTKDLPHVSDVDIQHNVTLTDVGGIPRQFDLYWERKEFGSVKKSILECKDYQDGVSIDRVDALIGKMDDFPDITPILVTSFKYQLGALQKAKNHNIEILVVREENAEQDWKDEAGNPLIRRIDGDIICIKPLHIISFAAMVDKKLGISPESISARNDLLFFGDYSTGWRMNLLDLSSELENVVSGYTTVPQKYRRMLVDGYEEYLGKRIAIRGFEVEYVYPPPSISHMRIEPVVEAVFEYVLKGQKEILMSFEGKHHIATHSIPLDKRLH